MVESAAGNVGQLSATARYANNMASAVYGLIITGALLAAWQKGERAGEMLGFLVMTLSLFWAAHVYSELLGEWSASGKAPDRHAWAAEMRRQWPMMGAAVIPSLLLVAAILDVMRDGTAVGAALAVCATELAVAGFAAARRGGGNILACVLSGAAAFCFGVALIIAKSILH